MKLGLVGSFALRVFAVLLAALAVTLARSDRALAQNLIVDGGTFTITPATDRTYDHICITGGAVVTVTPYAGGDKGTEGNLELIAGSVYVEPGAELHVETGPEL